MNVTWIKKLSQGQRARLSEIFGNISIAWFSAGIISPLFILPKSIFDFLISLGVSLVMTSILFTGLSNL